MKCNAKREWGNVSGVLQVMDEKFEYGYEQKRERDGEKGRGRER